MQSADTELAKPPFHRRHKSAILVATLLLLILLHPVNAIFERSALRDMVLLTIVMSASLNALSYRSRFTIDIGVGLGILAVAFGWLEVLLAPHFKIFSDSFGASLYIYIAALLFKSIMTENEITVDQLFAAVAIYILIGLTWGNFYAIINLYNPEALNFAERAYETLEKHDYIYFSFVTLTTLGYGDILPVSGIARSLVIVEAITGVMFIAIMISRLVGRINMKD